MSIKNFIALSTLNKVKDWSAQSGLNTNIVKSRVMTVKEPSTLSKITTPLQELKGGHRVENGNNSPFAEVEEGEALLKSEHKH
jgi:hypothetical protein